MINLSFCSCFGRIRDGLNINKNILLAITTGGDIIGLYDSKGTIMCGRMTTDDLFGLIKEVNRSYTVYLGDKNILNQQIMQKAAENLDRALCHDIQEKEA